MLFWPCFLFTGLKEMVVLIFIQIHLLVIRQTLTSRPLQMLHLMTKFDFMGIQNLPCEQRFLSCMAFNVHEVIHVAYQFCTWLVL